MMRNVLVWGALTFLTIAPIAGCDSNASGPAPIVGTYTLRFLNGSALPLTIPATYYDFLNEGVPEVTYNSGNIVLETGNKFTTTSNYSVTVPGQERVATNLSCEGTFTQKDSIIAFSEFSSGNGCGAVFMGNWNGGNILRATKSFRYDGVYEK